MLFAAHGAVFLSLKTSGEMVERARRLTNVLLPGVVLVGGGFIAWTLGTAYDRGHLPALALIAGVLAALAAVAATLLHRTRRDGWAFVATGLTVASVTVMLFADLWPNAIASSGAGDLALSLVEAASSNYTLGVMTVVAVVLTPVVLLYQGWTYWVFRRRVARPAGDGEIGVEPPTLPGAGLSG